jgi:hypothetical protein
MDSRELKRLTEKYSIDQLETCISQQLEKGENACELVDEEDKMIAELSEATVVRELMNSGMKFSEALRELGRRIRTIYSKEENSE